MQLIVSPLALRLWKLLLRGGTMTLDEAKSELRTSKSGVNRALQELEDLGLINTDIEEDV